MQVLSQTQQANTIRNAPTTFFRRVLGAILQADARYREAHKLRKMPDERLHDMGISRQAADAAFYARYGNHAADQAPIRLQNQW